MSDSVDCQRLSPKAFVAKDRLGALLGTRMRLVALMLLLGPRLALAAAPSAQSRLQALVDGVDVQSCTDDPEWGLRDFWITGIQLPSGLVHLSVLSGGEPGAPEDVSALQACLSRSPSFATGSYSAPAPARAILAARHVTVPEAPSGVKLREALEAARARILACVLERNPGRRTLSGAVRVEVSAEGKPSFSEPVSNQVQGLSECVRAELPASVRSAATRFRLSFVSTRGPANLPRHDGTAGAICVWGANPPVKLKPGEHLPAPAPCGEGLICCYGGGIPGLASSCMPASRGGCPAYP